MTEPSAIDAASKRLALALDALAAAHDDVRVAVGVSQQAALTMRDESKKENGVIEQIMEAIQRLDSA